MYKDRRGKFNELDAQTVACHTAFSLTNNLLNNDRGI